MEVINENYSSSTKTFLGIHNMRELRDLGMDTEDARYFIACTEEIDKFEPFVYSKEPPALFHDPNFYVYSLGDILEKLDKPFSWYAEKLEGVNCALNIDVVFALLKSEFAAHPEAIKKLKFDKPAPEPELDSSIFY